MAFGHGSKQKIVWNGFDLSPFSRGLDIDASVDSPETTVFGLASKTYLTGQKDAKVSLDGIMDGAATGNDPRLFADLAATAVAGLVATSFPQGDANPNAGYAFLAYDVGIKVSTPVADVASLTAQFQVTGGPERVLALHALINETGLVNSASIDNAASSANGGVGYLQADGGGAAGTTVCKIQHSTDNSSFPDLITFATVTNNTRSAERQAIGGTINRYTRSQVGGTTQGAKIQLAFGRL